MNVIILGGIGTKKNHIQNLIKLYKKINLNPMFYEAGGFMGNNLYRPKKFKNNTLNIVKEIKNQDKPFIIHSFSGSNWLAYDINKQITSKSIILESSPIIPSYDSFNNFINVNYNFQVHKNILKIIMNTIEIPTIENNEFKNWYQINKPKNNTLILIGENDKLLCQKYIKENYIESFDINKLDNKLDNQEDEKLNNQLDNKLDNKLVIFENCGHCNIYKHNKEQYNNTITKWIKEINLN